ncbi:MAG: gfo/Idh/MocA family oxidoreductase [Puniceicoccaceae bacterium]|nr:MAG: gfo/Idh/MocA family oxidoreductase [Puniceicoccaceae bacterium]
MKPVKTGLAGCGAIAPAYLQNLTSTLKPWVEVTFCADLVPEAARSRAEAFGIPKSGTFDELLADPEVELVINLTPAPAHHQASLAILDAGKHLFTEKPLALSRAHGREILDRARTAGLRVAGASDTFLGAGLQLSRRLIDEGAIGTPLAATSLVSIPAYNRERYHSVFHGALLDLGPYYLTGLAYLLGPIRKVASAADQRFREKPHPADSDKAGTTFPVKIPTTVAAALDFADGSVGSLIASCDVHGYFPRTEILGTEGVLVLPDCNGYAGAAVLRRPKGEESIAADQGFAAKGRGLGVAEMARALRNGTDPMAGGELLFHLLDAMLAVHDASRENRRLTLESTWDRPGLLDLDGLTAS